MKSVNIAVIGAGVVGSAFLQQLGSVKSSIKYNLIYLATSKKAVYDKSYSPFEIGQWSSLLQSSVQTPLSPHELTEYLKQSPIPVILVDNTSNETLANSYPLFLKNGVSVATPNKKAFSSSLTLWNDIFAAENTGLCFHEASVGAGLPLISPLKEMVATGDEIQSIEGILSGTLSYIFNEYSTISPNTSKFSDIVKVAKNLGYTEPDPRDDLNGLDVARKVTILARIAGLQVESPTSFSVQSLIPKQLESVESADEYLQKLPDFDHEMEKLKSEAAQEGKVLRFIGKVDVASKKTSVEIAKYDASHPFAALKGSDNVISIKSKRYPNPLIIQGAGAGAEVTAMGVLGDVIKVAERIATVQK
ncbi:hypothetical protein OGAPHI_005162 [Ogataea philodendri]|uniref:Homoserine dehydrogenase n=1 Tax=Ogataea philodendri TaxID=1378263 RepID=A0A9P8P264_9ASCO|nr:uncharacterized protein OGAPHI_005162 [Ogataea philodendri]KAH3663760.1 hypothetical protein OGAPHI_005162 [Ogataea philodendri]